MKAVGPGLGDHVNLSTAVVTVFRIEVVGDDAEFGDGIQVGNQRGAVVNAFLRIAAIHHETIGARSAAVDGLRSVREITRHSRFRQAGALGQPNALVR